MTRSETIGALTAALVKVQGEIVGAKKDETNPFYSSKYADLASVWESCRGPLSKNGLAVIQTTGLTPDGLFLFTTLSHTSGEWVQGAYPLRPLKDDPQGMGSCVSYARRYALAAIVGVYQVDDDGNAASQARPVASNSQNSLKQSPAIKPAIRPKGPIGPTPPPAFDFTEDAPF